MDKLKIHDGGDVFDIELLTDLVATVNYHGMSTYVGVASEHEAAGGLMFAYTSRFERVTARGINAGSVLLLFDSPRDAMSAACRSLVLRRMKSNALLRPAQGDCGSRSMREFLDELASNPRVQARPTGGCGGRKT